MASPTFIANPQQGLNTGRWRDYRTMEHPTFWRLIARIDRGALRDGDDEGAIDPLVEALSQCTEDDIAGFADILAECLYGIDGRVYAEASGESAQSSDGFLYARCYVVARGQKFYESVKATPGKMPKSADQWCEALLYVAERAWAAATGRDEEEWSHESPRSFETGSNQANW